MFPCLLQSCSLVLCLFWLLCCALWYPYGRSKPQPSGRSSKVLGGLMYPVCSNLALYFFVPLLTRYKGAHVSLSAPVLFSSSLFLFVTLLCAMVPLWKKQTSALSRRLNPVLRHCTLHRHSMVMKCILTLALKKHTEKLS